MGTVYLCENKRLGNHWAVKEVDSLWKDKVDFLAEPNILKNLSHVGIVRIIDIFYENDNLYIVEDYIEGKTVKEHVDANGPLSSEAVKDITLQLCSILDYLHSLKPPIVYRDLKPSNIMITPYNKVVLIDFGIARTYKEGKEGDTVVLGSRGYIAPEQLLNIQSNVQTDIYSLGVTMFFMLTGKSLSQQAELMLEGNYPGHVSKNLIEVIQKASAIEPESRYSDVKLMISELNAITTDEEYNKTMIMNAHMADEEYNKTAIMNSHTEYGEYNETAVMDLHESSDETTKTVLLENRKNRKRIKLIMIAAFACIIALVIFFALHTNNKTTDKNTFESPVDPKVADKTEANEQPQKEVAEYDTIVKGILDLNNPIILSSGDNNIKDKNKNKKKNKDKDEYKNVQFILNPAAAISNSKLFISLTSIVKMDDDIIVVLSIQNRADVALNLDLSKTYLVNGDDKPAKVDNPNSISLISISQSSSKQELKLYFKDFDFEGSQYILKTVLSSSVKKDINLNIDIKGNIKND